jgi:hypothetical protein
VGEKTVVSSIDQNHAGLFVFDWSNEYSVSCAMTDLIRSSSAAQSVARVIDTTVTVLFEASRASSMRGTTVLAIMSSPSL